MSWIYFLVAACVAVLQGFNYCVAKSIEEDTIIRLSTDNYCFALLNGSTASGCQSQPNGNTGAIITINSSENVDYEAKNLPIFIYSIIAFVNVIDFKRDLVTKLQTSSSISGVLLYSEPNLERPYHFSEDSSCPNRQFSSYYKSHEQCKPLWNQDNDISGGSGLKFLRFNKPILYLTNSKEIEWIKKCIKYSEQNRHDGILCFGRVTQFMRADGHSKLCLERQKAPALDFGTEKRFNLCDPLEDRNIISIIPPLTEANRSNYNSFVLGTRMDSFSTFTNSPGSDISSLTSLIAMLAVSDAIGRNLSKFVSAANKSNRQLILAFFHGESMGAIGSSRWIWEMQRNGFPTHPRHFPTASDNIKQLGIDAISAYLELQQIDDNTQLFLHTDKDIYNKQKSTLTDMSKVLSEVAKRNNFGFTFEHDGQIPPSSYESVRQVNETVPGAVFTSFGSTGYRNRYINSIFDTEVRMASQREREKYARAIFVAAEGALHTILNYIYGPEYEVEQITKTFRVDERQITSLMNCLLARNDTAINCSRFNALDWLKHNRYLDSYISVRSLKPHSLRPVVQTLLAQFLGEKRKAENTQNQCEHLNANQNVYRYYWQYNSAANQSYCYATSVYETMARSPAFDIPGYDFLNGTYSTWTESQWDVGSTRNQLQLYFKADFRLELCALITLAVVLVISGAMYFTISEEHLVSSTASTFRSVSRQHTRHTYNEAGQQIITVPNGDDTSIIPAPEHV